MATSVLKLALRRFILLTTALGALASCGPADSDRDSPGPPLERLPIERFEAIRSVTFYTATPLDEYLVQLTEAIPSLKAAGFNTVWLVLPWATFDPAPFRAPRIYAEDNFDALRGALDDLEQQGMRAILGLNYLGRGWSPSGIDACTWDTSPQQYEAFQEYAVAFLTEIKEYSDDVYILVFTESALLCEGSDAYAEGPSIAEQLRSTLGRLPMDIPPDLRSRFQIGYHDNTMITRDWARGETPIAEPNPFDFLSLVAYGLEEETRAEIKAELSERVGRFEALHPAEPLMIGELGATYCPPFNEETQARVIGTIVRFALRNDLSFNVWHWMPVGEETRCVSPPPRGLALLREDGSPRPVVGMLRDVLASSSG